MDTNKLTFGEKIRTARKQKGLTQKELASMIGAKHNSVSDWEKNKNRPDPDTIELICGVLDITPNYLLSDKTDTDISPEEYEFIKKYRSLTDYGKETINLIIEREITRPELNASPIIQATSHANTSADNMITFSFSSHTFDTWDTSNFKTKGSYNSITVLPPYNKLPPTLQKLLDESPDGLWTEAHLTGNAIQQKVNINTNDINDIDMDNFKEKVFPTITLKPPVPAALVDAEVIMNAPTYKRHPRRARLAGTNKNVARKPKAMKDYVAKVKEKNSMQLNED